EEGKVELPTLLVAPGKHTLRFASVGADRDLTLGTGQIDFKVKEGEAQKAEKPTEMSWGKTVNGLQAGVGLRPAAKRSFQAGDKGRLVLQVRNVSKERQTFQSMGTVTAGFWFLSPTVEDENGNQRKVLNSPESFDFDGDAPALVEVGLEPGKTYEIGTTTLSIA